MISSSADNTVEMSASKDSISLVTEEICPLIFSMPQDGLWHPESLLVRIMLIIEHQLHGSDKNMASSLFTLAYRHLAYGYDSLKGLFDSFNKLFLEKKKANTKEKIFSDHVDLLFEIALLFEQVESTLRVIGDNILFGGRMLMIATMIFAPTLKSNQKCTNKICEICPNCVDWMTPQIRFVQRFTLVMNTFVTDKRMLPKMIAHYFPNENVIMENEPVRYGWIRTMIKSIKHISNLMTEILVAVNSTISLTDMHVEVDRKCECVSTSRKTRTCEIVCTTVPRTRTMVLLNRSADKRGTTTVTFERQMYTEPHLPKELPEMVIRDGIMNYAKLK